MKKAQIWQQLKDIGNPDGLTWRTPKAELLQSLNTANQFAEDIKIRDAQRQEWNELLQDFDLGNLFDPPNLLTVRYTANVIISNQPRTITGSVRVPIGADPEELIEADLDKVMDDYGQKISGDYTLEFQSTFVSPDEMEFQEADLDATVYTHHSNLVDAIQRTEDCALHAVHDSLQKAVDRKDIKAVSLQDIMAVLDRKYDKGNNTLTISEVMTLCSHYNINLMVADATGKVQIEQKCPMYINSKRCYGALHFVAQMGHCYTISDKRTFRRKKRSKKYWYQPKETKKFKSVIADNLEIAVDTALEKPSKHKPTHVFVRAEYFEQQHIFDIMVERKMLFSIKATDSNITKLEHRGCKIIACKDMGDCTNICSREKMRYTGQSIASLAVTLFDKTYKGAKFTSEFSNNGKDIFENHISVTACSFGIAKSHEAAYDISKCYTHCANTIEEYPVYTVFDEPEPYDGTMKLGFYFIETKNSFPLDGNGWYSSTLIQYCIDQGIELEIVCQYIPQYTVKNPFREFIEYVVKNHRRASKKLINYFIGTLNRAPKETEDIVVTNSFQEYVYYANSNDKARFARINDLYKIAMVKPAPVYVESNKPLYSFIIDQGKIEVHKLAQLVGGELVGVKTDCVYVRGDFKEPPLGKNIGEYRKEEGSYPPESNGFIPHFNYDLPAKKQWQDIKAHTDASGYCIDGAAGTGKSYIINNLESKAIRCAFTNAAARNISGITLHNAFRVNTEGKAGNTTNEDLIIDEYSMIPETLYALILKRKLMFPNCRIILAGDCRQIQFIPREGLTVNKEFPRVNTTETFKFICDYKLQTLTECKRADDTYFNACLSGDYKSIAAPKDGRLKSVNITRTNKRRAQLNMNFNRIYARNARVLQTRPNHNFNRGNGDPVYGTLDICEGSRWISDARDNKLGIVKNTFYDIKDGKLVSEGGHVVELGHIGKFSLRWAMTVNKLQGATITRNFIIHEFDRMDDHSKYTAVSRGTKPGQFQIYH